ncbi:DNA primase [Bacillus idriensis]|uniref:DNA primase n=1 Tax=Metabacillus idriensis TaxID=324768 RepID=A0A6I2MA29_9BACI|nr:toprim domain-containing protein [Metabacillus idriensis]MRX54649.1 DNA primase [Metabacillus idriensis]
MPNVNLGERTVDVDIRYELEQFEWTRATWFENKLLAASPFRYDKSPSFYVYLDDTPSAPAGSWGDAGWYEAEFAKGGFVKLLAFLRNDSEEETADYLLEAYGESDGAEITLRLPQLKVERNRQPIESGILEPYKLRHPYLGKRGISEQIQRLANVGYSRQHDAVTLPWFLPDGRLANVKYRKTRGKAFFYEKGAWPIRELIYGIDIVYSRKVKRAVVCEAEIDALSWMTSGYMAVAVGGSSFNRRKAEILAASPLEEIVVIADNDKAGGKLRDQIVEEMRGKMAVKVGAIDARYKDANEVLVSGGVETLRKAVEMAEVSVSVRGFTYSWSAEGKA